METIKLAPDWFFNTNHTGFVVAQQLGFYSEVGVRLELSAYLDHPTAARRVASGNALFGLGPQETVIAYADKTPHLVALAAINAHNPSALAVLLDSPITRPAELGGKRYASYGARFEMHVVRQMIRNDGGLGDVEELVLAKPTVPDALMTGQADCTWVFPAWEAVEAELQGTPLRLFRLRDYGVPDMYTPVIFTRAATLTSSPEQVARFMAATARGFELAAAQPQRAAELLLESGYMTDKRLADRSQREASASYRDADAPWGKIQLDTWATYGRYLHRNGFIRDRQGNVSAEPDWHKLVSSFL